MAVGVDITIGGIPLPLDREKSRPFRVQALENPGNQPEQSESWTSFEAGGFYSRHVPGVNGYAWGDMVDARWGYIVPSGKITELALPGDVITAGSRLVDAQLWNNDLFIVTDGRYILNSKDATNAPFISADGGAGFVGKDAVNYQGALYVGSNNSGMFVLSGSPGSWALYPSIIRGHMATVYWEPQGAPGERLVATSDAAKIRWVGGIPSSSDPTNDSHWLPASGLTVGDPNYSIKKLIGGPQHLYAVKQDGIYDITPTGSSARSPNLTPYWRRAVHANNGEAAVFHLGQIISGYVNGLDAVSIGRGLLQPEPAWITPGAGRPWEGPIWGKVSAADVDGNWLVVAQYNGTDSYVSYGTPDNQGGWLWHTALAVIRGAEITLLKVVGPGGTGRLIIGTHDGTRARLYWQSLPLAGTSPIQLIGSGSHTFNETFTMYLPVTQFGAPGAVKYLMGLEAEGEGISSTRYLQFWAAVNGGDWNTAGTMTENEFDVRTLDPLATGRSLAMRVDGYGTTARPPILRALTPWAKTVVRTRDVREYHFVLRQGLHQTQGTTGRRDPETVWRDFAALTGEAPVAMRDHRDRNITVKVLQGLRRYEEEEDGGGWAIHGTAVVEVVGESWIYDTGRIYDTGGVYA